MIGFLILTAALWMVFFLLALTFTGRKQRMRSRLESIAVGDGSSESEDLPPKGFGERVVLPLADAVYRMISSASSTHMRTQIEKRLRMIGRTGPRVVEQWLSIRLVPGLVLPASVGLLLYRWGTPLKTVLLISGTAILVFQLLMNYYLIKGVRLRKEAIEKQLPDVLDIITVSVEAGLSFDGAVERVIQKADNDLTRELATTLKEMRMGKLRKLALRALAERCEVPDLTIWVGAMIQADELGVGIGNVLRVQSNQMREKRRFKAREKSMKAPIKMLFPLVMFIFPSIFIILLGPAMIHLMDAFGK